MLQNRAWLVCRNFFPWCTCMMRIFYLPLQTHFSSPPTPASACSLWGWSQSINTLALCTETSLHVPRSAPLPCLPSDWCSLSRANIVLKIVELGLSSHFRLRLPLLWWFLQMVHRCDPTERWLRLHSFFLAPCSFLIVVQWETPQDHSVPLHDTIQKIRGADTS